MVIDSLTGGGAEKVVISLAEAMVEMGHMVTILSLSEHCDYLIPDRVSLHCLFEGKAAKVDRFWQLRRSINKLEQWFDGFQKSNGRFDLILSNLDKSNNLLAQSGLQDYKNLFFIIHNSVEEELKRQKKMGPFAYGYLAKSKSNLEGKQLVTVSKGIENEIKSNDAITPLSIQTIYNPFDFKNIKQQSSIDNNDIPKSHYIIHVGRLARQKRHDILFEAFKELDQKYQLVLLCNKPKKAKKLAKKYGIEDRVILPGFQSNPYNWIRHAEVLVLSSDYEGFGNVLVEALSVGTKVVSTRCPHGPDEILTGELSNFLVPRRDIKSLLATLSMAVDAKVDVQSAKILQQVSADKIAKQYLALCS